VIRYVLDTNAVGMVFAGHPVLLARIGLEPQGTVGTTPVSLEESLGGWYTYLRKAKTPSAESMAFGELVRTTVGYAQLPFLPLTVAALARANALVRLKMNVKKNDLRIAAIALEAGATVVTANVRDFTRVPGLSVEDWTRLRA